jgi:hypothetical protein
MQVSGMAAYRRETLFPTIAVWLGWRGLFAEKTFAVWGPDFIPAFALGIAFQ